MPGGELGAALRARRRHDRALIEQARNAAPLLADLAGRIGADPAPYRVMAERVRAGFQRYLRTDGVGLLDLLNGPHGNDASIRPNQLLAVSREKCFAKRVSRHVSM